MAQLRKKSGQRAPASSKKPAKARAPSASKRAKQDGALQEGDPERAAGPVNPDSMSAEVIEFITAVDEYKRKRGRPFPSWSEILEIVKRLGYRKAG